jgi:hypothetical protein
MLPPGIFPPLPLNPLNLTTLFIATADYPNWINGILMVVCSTGVAGAIVALLKRRWDKQDAAIAASKTETEKKSAADVNLATINLNSIQENIKRNAEEVHKLKNEYQKAMAEMQLKLEMLEDDNERIKMAYVDLYMFLYETDGFFTKVRNTPTSDGTVTIRLTDLPRQFNLENLSPAKVFAKKHSDLHVQVNVPGVVRSEK